jgi:triphosphatase
VEQGWQRIVGNCLLQIQGNAAGVAGGGDPDSLHQMRVGLRRLRSAFGLFAAVAPCPAALRTELEWLGATLGPARDWEVCATDTLASVAAACPGQPELARLQKAAQAVARRRRQAAAEAVASVRFARLLLSLGGWIQGARWRAPFAAVHQAALQAPLARFATQALAQRRRKLKQRGKRLKEATPPARHRMRVAAKKVRYATEFFESLYPARRVRPAVAALTALQDALGRLNDAAVAGRLLQRFAAGSPELAHGAGFVRGYLAARSERDARRLRKLWKRLAPRQLAGADRKP